MSRKEKYHQPFTMAWFLQRTRIVLKERRFPDMTLIREKLKSFFFRKGIRKNAGFTRIPSELLEPTSYRHASPLIIERDDHEEQNLINNYFDRIYVISPHSRSDSRLAMIRKLKHLGIKANFIETDDADPFYSEDLSGLSLILADALKNNYQRILCLKDSVIFTKNFHEKFRNAIAGIPDDWQLLYLGARQESWEDGIDLIRPVHNNPVPGNVSSVYHPVNTSGTFALGMDKCILKALEKGLRPGQSFPKPFPLGINGISREKCFVLYPNLIVDPNALKGRESGSPADVLKWDLKEYEEGPEPDLVSVIMPAFNAERTIEKSILSILRQSYRNLELIVADDCSSDNTRSIVKELARSDSRVRLVERRVNQGCYFARNDALRASSGKYIAIQDADDISLARRIEKQLIPLAAGDALFTLAWILRSRLKINELDLGDEPGMIRKVLENRVLRPDRSYGYWDRPILGFMTSVYDRSLFEELGLFWEYRFGADAEFFERIIFSKTGRILKPDEPNVHTLLLHTGSIPGIYRRVEQILLISAEMNEQNITRSYHSEELNNFIANYRAKYTGDFDYAYPEFK